MSLDQRLAVAADTPLRAGPLARANIRLGDVISPEDWRRLTRARGDSSAAQAARAYGQMMLAIEAFNAAFPSAAPAAPPPAAKAPAPPLVPPATQTALAVRRAAPLRTLPFTSTTIPAPWLTDAWKALRLIASWVKPSYAWLLAGSS